MYLVNKIIRKCEESSGDWRRGASGGRTIKIESKDYHICGKSELIEEAKSLEVKKLLEIKKWVIRGSDIDIIAFRVEHLQYFYELARQKGQSNIWPKQEKVDYYQKYLEEELEKGFSKSWIREYYQWLLKKVTAGEFSPNVEKFLQRKEVYFSCFRGVDELEQPMLKRLFSKKYLNNSKVFENELEDHVISIARQYWENLDENMDKTTILSQLQIEEYSQTLEIKGPFKVLIQRTGIEQMINLGAFTYGVTLNSAMLQNCRPALEQEEICRIITIENKANFVMAPYDENTLYIFTHGYFSPKEVVFLKQLESCLQGRRVEYYHSGDLDYGGIRIFQFIKKNVFTELKPWMMDAETFDYYQEYGEKLKSTTAEKIKKLNVPELQGLIDKILESGMTIEQESFLLDE